MILMVPSLNPFSSQGRGGLLIPVVPTEVEESLNLSAVAGGGRYQSRASGRLDMTKPANIICPLARG